MNAPDLTDEVLALVSRSDVPHDAKRALVKLLALAEAVEERRARDRTRKARKSDRSAASTLSADSADSADAPLSPPLPSSPTPPTTNTSTLPPAAAAAARDRAADGEDGTDAAAAAARGRRGDRPLPPSPGPLADLFALPHHAAAYAEARRTAGSPAAFDHELRLLAEGGEASGRGRITGRGWGVVGEALHEMSVNAAKPTAKTLRGYCDRIGEPARPSPAAAAGAAVVVGRPTTSRAFDTAMAAARQNGAAGPPPGMPGGALDPDAEVHPIRGLPTVTVRGLDPSPSTPTHRRTA